MKNTMSFNTENFSAELKEFEANTWAIYTDNNDQLFAKYHLLDGITFHNPNWCMSKEIMHEFLTLIDQITLCRNNIQ